ncbi:MAG: GMC family oxidoreductase [Polyangia bacterium]
MPSHPSPPAASDTITATAAQPAPHGTDHDDFDFIVIGGGSAGCVVAGELARRAAVRILVLEAGPAAEEHPETLRAEGYKQAFINDALMWDRVSERQPGCANNRIFLGSGKVSGGSASINAMVYTRGDRRDYAEWDVPGWRWEDLEPDFRAVEERLGVRRMPPTRFSETCITASEQIDFRRKDDLNDGDLCGFLGYEWMNQDGTRRNNSYARFLKPRLDLPEGMGQGIGGSGGVVKLVNHALVERVVISDGRAGAVRYRHGGRVYTVAARREIVLCAGALETPKLLLLSGVGPREELERHGIPVAAALPGVGRNLQDHPNVSLFFVGEQPTDYSFPQLYGFHRAGPPEPASPEPASPAARDTSPSATGARPRLADDQADTCYVFYTARSSFREGVLRLLPLIALPLPLYRVALLRALLRALVTVAFFLPPLQRLIERMYGVVVILGKPRSRGRLTLRSKDAAEPACIDPAYFTDPADLDTLYRGVERARRIVGAPALTQWGGRPVLPGPGVRSEAALRRFIKKNAMTTYHYGGTCRMGLRPEDGAVVDPELRVHGVRGLRIADASIFPTVPVAALNAPSMAVGHRAARLLAAAAAEGASAA